MLCLLFSLSSFLLVIVREITTGELMDPNGPYVMKNISVSTPSLLKVQNRKMYFVGQLILVEHGATSVSQQLLNNPSPNLTTIN